MVAPALFSSAKQDWETPQGLFDRLDNEFHFGVDVCANKTNAKVPQRYYDLSRGQDGLQLPWSPSPAWCNPPYGREVGQWVAKAAEERSQGRISVLLLPARTDTKWFHSLIWRLPGREIRFLRGRVRFVRAPHPAPFPSMIVIFRP